ncbi:MAG: Gfo/Idh/MocA family oxidoreductase [Planctomycetes bacterium]|nr:Gfo/Idh/MocA family oxidoreductase [Planctomycetota bacterium]
MLRRSLLVAGVMGLMGMAGAVGAGEKEFFRVGIVGLDTSHVVAFTELMNNPAKNYGCKVVVGYPGGSPDIESSISRVKGYTETLQKKFGVEIVDSIETLCQKVDGVLLESVDGRPHLAQVRPVIAAKKPVFIDKPMAGSLADALEIFRLAKETGVPCWSSSSLRFGPGTVALRNSNTVGKIMGCDAFSPSPLEEHHPDLYWYGIHGVEMLFTIMGPGCVSVQRAYTKDHDVVVGVWKDGRIGTFRGLRVQKEDYGTLVFGSKGIVKGPGYEGYGPLVEEIVKFFKTGQVPVPPEETIEILAFMTAADASKTANGAKVELATVLEEARKQNAARR